MHVRISLGIATLLLVGVGPAAAQTLDIRFEDGLISLQARNAPIRAVLAEWARVGETRITNADRLAGEVTLELDRVPERQALSILLRGASGFIASAREGPSPGVSQFATILIASSGTQNASSLAPVQSMKGASAGPLSATFSTDVGQDPDDEESERRAIQQQLFGGREAEQDGVADDEAGGAGVSAQRANPSAPVTGSKRPGIVTPTATSRRGQNSN